jgi:DNA-binding protein HU-beta
MNKSELIEQVARDAQVSASDAEGVIAALLQTVVETCARGDKVAWPGFGSFMATTSSERIGRNPQTGGSIVIQPSTRLRFKASSAVKNLLNAQPVP